MTRRGWADCGSVAISSCFECACANSTSACRPGTNVQCAHGVQFGVGSRELRVLKSGSPGCGHAPSGSVAGYRRRRRTPRDGAA
jgi:hypothetical protein